MTPAQVAVNARAVANLAARLERMGWTGDTHAEAEAIATNLHADGWRPIPPPVPTRGPGASRQAIDQALTAAAQAVAASRRRRTTVNEESKR